MESYISREFTEEIKSELLGRYGILPHDCALLGGFENFVFNVKHNGKNSILRITHGSHQTAAALEGELDFILHLKNHGLTTPGIIPSQNELLVESTGTSQNDFHAVLFEKSPGRLPEEDDLGPDLIREWGRVTGQMHRLAQSYSPASGRRRANWNEDDLVVRAAEYLPSGHEVQLKALAEVMDRMRSWPTTSDVFGLVHTDLHRYNFFWFENKVIPFDFDDAAYNWYVYDIAVVLFSSADTMRRGLSFDEYAAEFLPLFLEGYQKEFDLPMTELDRIQDLIRFREILLVAVLHKKLGPDRFDARALELMNSINERILNGTHAFELAFKSL